MTCRRGRPRTRTVLATLFVAALALGSAGAAHADLTPDPLRDPASESFQTLQRNVLAKAQPDACYYGTDVSMQPMVDGACPTRTFTLDAGTPQETTVTREGRPKVNQAYVWGLTKSANNRLWWGTGPNIHCLVLTGYLGQTTPIETSSYVCDPDQNFKPPDIFMYDESSGIQTDLRTKVPAGAETSKLNATVGMRSAGSADGVVFFAGPGATGGVNMFAFDDATGSYLGSATLPAYTNIRKWVTVQGELYTGVAVRPSTEYPKGGGMVLRWVGTKAAPFTGGDHVGFEKVGYIDGEAAELAEHDGRLFVATWPCCESAAVPDEAPAALWMSPLFGADKTLTQSDLGSWKKVWSADDYEPDKIIANHYGGGSLASYGGSLYWGTMHVPGTSSADLQATYGDAAGDNVFIRASRAIVIFRGDDFGTANEKINVLYGDAQEWAFDGVTETWSQKPTGKFDNATPGGLYGASGFGNPLNNYTWELDVFQGQLYVGTMDYSYLILDALDESDGDAAATLAAADTEAEDDMQRLIDALAVIRPGADLWRFPAPDKRAVPESLQGVGNYLNYGVRTMVADDAAKALYIGSANPMNLMTDTTDRYPEGGWELIRLTPKETTPPAPGDTNAPVSSASGPATSTARSWTVGYTASDAGGSGVAKVELFVKKPGASAYVSAGVDTTTLDNRFTFDSGGVEGAYAFYTVATDKAGNVEAVPASADVTTTYAAGGGSADAVAPVSKAAARRLTNDSPFTVRYVAADEVGGSGLATVGLFVKSPAASTYTSVGADTGTAIDGRFSYEPTAGDGLYRFYTVATDLAGNIEAAPAVADTRTRLDTTPPSILRAVVVPNPFDLGDDHRALLRMRVSERGFGTFQVRHDGEVVKHFRAKVSRAGKVQRVWTGRDDDGRRVGAGSYVVVMKARDLAGNTAQRSVSLTITR